MDDQADVVRCPLRDVVERTATGDELVVEKFDRNSGPLLVSCDVRLVAVATTVLQQEPVVSKSLALN
jgi:hypothetical protein